MGRGTRILTSISFIVLSSEEDTDKMKEILFTVYTTLQDEENGFKKVKYFWDVKF